MRIEEAARIIGVPAHVLRHWEDVGALTPRRLPNGHRVFDKDSITSARLLRLCQAAGMSLVDITTLSRSTGSDRAMLVDAHRDHIDEQIAALQATKAFLDHVLDCHHPALSTCPACISHASPHHSKSRF